MRCIYAGHHLYYNQHDSSSPVVLINKGLRTLTSAMMAISPMASAEVSLTTNDPFIKPWRRIAYTGSKDCKDDDHNHYNSDDDEREVENDDDDDDFGKHEYSTNQHRK